MYANSTFHKIGATATTPKPARVLVCLEGKK